MQRRPLYINALKVALVVGTLLAAINYGDKILAGAMAGGDWLKLLLTYLVPFGVSLYSAYKAVRQPPVNSSTD